MAERTFKVRWLTISNAGRALLGQLKANRAASAWGAGGYPQCGGLERHQVFEEKREVETDGAQERTTKILRDSTPSAQVRALKPCLRIKGNSRHRPHPRASLVAPNLPSALYTACRPIFPSHVCPSLHSVDPPSLTSVTDIATFFVRVDANASACATIGVGAYYLLRAHRR